MITPLTFLDASSVNILSPNLLEEMDMTSTTPVFLSFYAPEYPLDTEVAELFGQTYVCDASYLETTGHILSSWPVSLYTHSRAQSQDTQDTYECQTIHDVYGCMDERQQRNMGFHDRYQYFSIPSEITSVLSFFSASSSSSGQEKEDTEKTANTEDTKQMPGMPDIPDTWKTHMSHHMSHMMNLPERAMAYNQQPWFMRLWTYYILGSPLMALVTPLMFMILPFILLKIMRIPITFENYYTYLKRTISGHALGNLFRLKGSSITQKLYILVSLAMYCMSMVRNVYDCYRYLHNQSAILDTLRASTSMLTFAKQRITQLSKHMGTVLMTYPHHAYQTYVLHLSDVCSRIDILYEDVTSVLAKVGAKSYPSMFTIGDTMACFYRIHQHEQVQELFTDIAECMGYSNLLSRVSQWFHVANQKAVVHWNAESAKTGQTAKTTKKDNKKEKTEPTPSSWIFEDLLPIRMLDMDAQEQDTSDTPKDADALTRFASAHSSLVSNTVDLSNHWIVTGPNASGKSTLLRSVLWNQILAQQWGIAFASRASCPIVHDFHCYLNVPDSYSRDSLFQAEARRCLQVLQQIQQTPDHTHLCIFDELYSGTNPVEATGGSLAYMQELAQLNHVKFMITTHYYDVVDGARTFSTPIHSAYMKVLNRPTGNEYTYRLESGMKKDYGALAVFSALGYSDSFLSSVQTFLDQSQSHTMHKDKNKNKNKKSTNPMEPIHPIQKIRRRRNKPIRRLNQQDIQDTQQDPEQDMPKVRSFNL